MKWVSKFWNNTKRTIKRDIRNARTGDVRLAEALSGKGWEPMLPVKTLFDFRKPETMKHFYTITDGIIDGFSKCDVAYNEGITYDTKETFIQLNNAKLFRHRRPELMVAENSCMFHLEEEFKPLDKTVKGEKIENDVIYIDPANFRPREGGAVFKGFLSRELPAHRADIVKSGFCIMRTKEFVPYMDLGQYDHLELRCRGDGRLYIMQIATKSAYDDDLFQYALPPLPANEWSVVHVPIDDFTLTYRGMVEGTQHDMHKEKIRHMGFMIAEPKEGEFKLELDYIRAVKRSKVKSDKRYSNGENILGQ